MTKTKSIRTTLHTTLNSILPSYYSVTQDPHPVDYAVYTLEEVLDQDGRISAQLEINVYGYGTDTEIVEENADQIQQAFDHGFFINDDTTIISYKNRRQTIEENDRKLLRRRLLFDVYIYERK